MAELEQAQEAIVKPSLVWFYGAAALLIILFIRSFFSLSWPVNHDCAMYLEAGQMLLQGKIPYIDFIDLNPPLIFYLSAIPAYFTQITGLSVDQSFILSVWLLCLSSCFLTAMIVKRAPAPDKTLFGPIVFGLAAFSFIVGEWGEFGQRQHLAALGLMPFIFCRWVRSTNNKVPSVIAIVSGCFFGLMIALVPQYALIPVAAELAFQWRKQSVRSLTYAEILSALLTILLYGMLIMALPEPARVALWQRWLPLTMHDYAAYNGDWMAFTTFPFIIGCLPLFLIGLAIALKKRCSLTIPLIVCYLAAYLATLIQLKGWYNHYVPMLAAAVIFICVQLQCWFDNQTRSRSELFKISVMTLILFVCTEPSALLRQSWHYPSSELETIKRETQSGDKVIVLSSAVPDIYPALLQAKRANGSRFLFLFPVEMLRYQEKNGKTATEKEKASTDLKVILTELEEDIDKSKPKLILIPCGKNAAERKISMLNFFEENGLIDKLAERYVADGECTGRKNTFAIWKRK